MLSQARALWRAARDAPVAGPLIAAADRMWWARTIRLADIVDSDVVSAQLGPGVSARAAIRHYVRGGFREGFTLNVLAAERTISRQLSDTDRVPALYAYLVNDRARLRVSTWWDAQGLAAAEPASLHDAAGPLGFAWRRARREGWVELGDAASTRRVAWSDVVSATSSPASGVGPTPTASKTRFVCVLGPEETDADEALALAREAEVELDADVDLVLTGRSFDEGAQAALLRLLSPRITVRIARVEDVRDPPAARRQGLTLFRGPHARLSLDTLRALADAGQHSAVAPLWLSPDGTIASAGTIFRNGEAIPLLSGHPVEDAQRVGPAFTVPALAGPARAWPAGAVPSGGGQTLTTATVTGGLAPKQQPRPSMVANTDIDRLLAPAGLSLSHWEGRAPVLEQCGTATLDGRRAMRWAIKTAAPAGQDGESWGDTHFARALSRALAALGQFAAVDAYEARARPSTYLDEVTVVLRGPHRIIPPKTGRRILWVISHPDEITADELGDFDVIFAASAPWAASATQRFGRPIRPLLQCTDVHRFRPSGAARTNEILFVGTARGIARPVVVEPLRAGVPVRVYGPDWTGYIPGSAIAATGVENSRLAAVYERAGVVLNDHWPAMRREGFVSNRLYDVVAAGGRAISDDVDGIGDLFGDAVRVYRSVPELIEMLRSDLDQLFPSEDRLATTASRVRARDSFDARAVALVEAVLSL